MQRTAGLGGGEEEGLEGRRQGSKAWSTPLAHACGAISGANLTVALALQRPGLTQRAGGPGQPLCAAAEHDFRPPRVQQQVVPLRDDVRC